MHYVVLSSAKKHGIHRSDMLNAIDNSINEIPQTHSMLIVGPTLAGNLIEVGFEEGTNFSVIFHAMKVQPRNLRRRT
jgi:hypothetical protein